MKKKYFISCIQPTKQLGAMQIEVEEDEVMSKSEELCPERAEFRAYEVEEFDNDMPIGEFVSSEELKKLGY